jgi:hypothetical protein
MRDRDSVCWLRPTMLVFLPLSRFDDLFVKHFVRITGVELFPVGAE